MKFYDNNNNNFNLTNLFHRIVFIFIFLSANKKTSFFMYKAYAYFFKQIYDYKYEATFS